MTQHAEAHPLTCTAADALLLQRGLTGARVLVVRGLLLRLISLGTNLALVTLVVPAELGLLAVVRATFEAIQFCSELGVQLALIRRKQEPSRMELASVTGWRTVMLVLVVATAAMIPQLRTVGGLVPAGAEGWMLLALGSLLITSSQSVSRVLLERKLAFGRLAVIETLAVLLQNTALVLFALAGRFEQGIFIVQATLHGYYTVALQLAQPGVLPSLRLAPLRALGRDSAGFSLAALLGSARESVPSMLIGVLFGLSTAGVWAFAARSAQFLQLTMEGYARSGVAITARLAGRQEAVRRLLTSTVGDMATLAFPLAALLCAGLPLLGAWLPEWRGAVEMAQQYVIAVGVLGVGQAALWPVVVAERGSRAAVIWLAISLGTILGGLAAIHALGIGNVAIPFIAGLVTSLVYLVSLVDRRVLPQLRTSFWAPLGSLIFSMVLLVAARINHLSPMATALLAGFPPAAVLGATLWRGAGRARRGAAAPDIEAPQTS